MLLCAMGEGQRWDTPQWGTNPPRHGVPPQRWGTSWTWGTPQRWGTPQTWDTPPGHGVPPPTWDGVPPLPRPEMGYPPQNVNRQTPVKTVPSRHTTYADGNKKVLLRERKRHTAHRVASTCCAVPVGGTPCPDLGSDLDVGYLPFRSWMGVPPSWSWMGFSPPLRNWNVDRHLWKQYLPHSYGMRAVMRDKFRVSKMFLTSNVVCLNRKHRLLFKPRHFFHCLNTSWYGRQVTIETLRFRNCSNIFLKPKINVHQSVWKRYMKQFWKAKIS